MNGGTCVSPGQCLCADGYQGPHCEGGTCLIDASKQVFVHLNFKHNNNINLSLLGMCREKCLNGGKCIQKDTCACRNGYYGARCDFSKYLVRLFSFVYMLVLSTL